MKKVITLIVLAVCAAGFNLNAQSTRLVLAEEFTQASCGPCASQNPTFNNLLNANSTKVVAIKYQTNWPGVDPMNVQTAALVSTRVAYYRPDTVGVPYAVMDGQWYTSATAYQGAPAVWTQAKLNTRANIASPYTMSVTHTISANYDSIFATVVVTASMADSGSLKLRIAVIERYINFCKAPGTNGETVFQGVMRTMIPNATGTTLAGNWTLGQTQTFNFAAAIPSYVYDKNQLAVVAFVQDDATVDVRQAAYSAPIPMAVDARMDCAFAGVPDFSCNQPLNPTVTIRNMGTSNLTTANIDYTVDGVAGTTIPWTGNLATNTTDVVALPVVNPTPGSHTITATISYPNSTSDLNTGNDVQSITFNSYGSTGLILPLTQDFTTTTFPPLPTWRVVNPGNGVTWIRSTAAYGQSGGSARISFYSISTVGEVDELWMPNYDFSVSGTTTASFDFEVAYSRYQTENDRLELQYSTDCGATWTSIYNEAGITLANGNPDTTGNWRPWNQSQWHHKAINIDNLVGQSSVFFKFKGTSAYGNNCFVDNINVSTNLTTGVNKIENIKGVSVYPNPSKGELNVQISLFNREDVTVVVTNSLGAIVKTMNIGSVSSGVYKLNLTGEAIGSYDVSVRTKIQTVTKRVTITE